MIFPPPPEIVTGSAAPGGSSSPSDRDDPAAGVLPSFREALARKTWLLALAGPVSALAGLGTCYIARAIFARSSDGFMAGDEVYLEAIRAGTLPAISAVVFASFGVFTGVAAKSSRITFAGLYSGLAIGMFVWLAGSAAGELAFVFLAPPLCGVFICWAAGVVHPWQPGLICGTSGGFMALATGLVLPIVGIGDSFMQPYRIVDVLLVVLFILVSPYLGAWTFFHTLRRGFFIWRGLDPVSSKSESESASSEKR